MLPFASIDSHALARCDLHVPSAGVWFAECELIDPASLSGRVTLTIGDLSCSGTIDASASGTAHDTITRVRVVGGAGKWGTALPPKSYHNDAGLRASVVVTDAAREAGESVGSLPTQTVGIDYVRESGPASRVLEALAPGWYVDLSGVTQCSPRSQTPATGYRVLSFDPQRKLAELEVESLRSVVPGATLSDRLPKTLPVRALHVSVTGSQLVVRAELGDGAPRLERALRSLMSQASEASHLRAYRVLRMVGDRVELQAVRPTSSPDLGPISCWPGTAGTHATLVAGQEVLVAYIDGDRSQPIITHFRGKDGGSWAPLALTLDASSEIKAGANATETLAWSSRMLAELTKIQTTLESLVITGSATGEFTVPYVAPSSASLIGSTKTKAE